MVKVYKSTPVEAIQFDGKNWLEICQWSTPGFEWYEYVEDYDPEVYPVVPSESYGDFMDDGPASLSVIVAGGDEWFAERGDWVVRRVSDGSWTVMSNEEFMRMYKESSGG